jgi:hypothetical protein
VAAAVEFVLEGLHLSKRLNKDAVGARATYRGRADPGADRSYPVILGERPEGRTPPGNQTPVEPAPVESAPVEPAPDPSADADRVYVGTLELAVRPWEDFDLTASRVELETTRESVGVIVDFTVRAGVRSVNNDTVCTATVRRVYSGTGSMAASVDVPVSPELQEIIAVEGSGCGVSDDWETTAEADLEAEFAEQEVLSLVGQFRDGTFTGNFTELFLVTATG